MPASGRNPRIARPVALNSTCKRQVSTGNALGPRGCSREEARESLNVLSALGSSKQEGEDAESINRPSTNSLEELWPEVSESLEPDDTSCRMHSSLPLNLSDRGLMDNYDDIFHRRRTTLNLKVQQSILDVHDNNKKTTTTIEGDLMTAIFSPCEQRRGREETRTPEEDDKTVPITFRVRSLSPSHKRNSSPTPPRRCVTSERLLESSFHRLQNSLSTKQDKEAYRRGGRSLSPGCSGRKNRSFSVLATTASVCAVQSNSSPSQKTSQRGISTGNGNLRRRRGRSPGSLAVAPPTYWEKPSVTLLRQATPDMIEQAKKERMARNDLRASQQSSPTGRASRGGRGSVRNGWRRLSSSGSLTSLVEQVQNTQSLSQDNTVEDEGVVIANTKSDAVVCSEGAGGKEEGNRKARRRRSAQRSLSCKDLSGPSFVTGSRIRRTNSGRNLNLTTSSSSDDEVRYHERASLSDDRKARRRKRRDHSPTRCQESGGDTSTMEYTSGIAAKDESLTVKSSPIDGWTKHFSHPATGDISHNNVNGRHRSAARTPPTRVRTLSPCPSAA